MYSRYFENVTEAVAVSDREVEFHFNQKGNRELPKILGDLVVLPKHWWEGTDANGKKRDITKATLEPPLGSAAYKIASFKPGSEIVWQRVPDYWGAKLPVKIGRENFDTDATPTSSTTMPPGRPSPRVASKTSTAEYSSAQWATAYNFPAIKAGDVIKKEFQTQSPRADAGFRAQPAPAAVPGPPGARGADLSVRLREHEPHAVLRLQHPHLKLFPGHRTGIERPAAGQGTGNPGTIPRQAAAGTVHPGIQAAGLRFAAGGAEVPESRRSISSPRLAG